MLSKGELANGSTFWAQGGVAAVLDAGDTVDSHVADTLDAGAGLCREEAVRFTVEHSREAIQWLIDQGVPFTRDEQHQEEASPSTSPAKAATATGASSTPRMPPARRSSTPCSRAPASGRTSSCSSSAWRWT